MFYDQITDFIFQEDQPQKCEFIFIPGSGYGELAVRRHSFIKKALLIKLLFPESTAFCRKNLQERFRQNAIVTGNLQRKVTF